MITLCRDGFAIYLEPHHPDIFEFLQLRKNHGNEEERCRDLFLAIWLNFSVTAETAATYPPKLNPEF